jgi:hypothetical protein
MNLNVDVEGERLRLPSVRSRTLILLCLLLGGSRCGLPQLALDLRNWRCTSWCLVGRGRADQEVRSSLVVCGPATKSRACEPRHDGLPLCLSWGSQLQKAFGISAFQNILDRFPIGFIVSPPTGNWRRLALLIQDADPFQFCNVLPCCGVLNIQVCSEKCSGISAVIANAVAPKPVAATCTAARDSQPAGSRRSMRRGGRGRISRRWKARSRRPSSSRPIARGARRFASRPPSRHARTCSGHPMGHSLRVQHWIAGTSPAMTIIT